MMRLPATPLAAIAIAIGLTLLEASAARAQATTLTTNTRVPISISVFVPCALAGIGEVVALTGKLHVVSHGTVTPSHRFRGKSLIIAHSQLSGVGLSSGTRYQGVDLGNSLLNTFEDPPEQFTFLSSRRIVGRGAGNNLLVHQTFHMTINAHGEVTADVGHTSATCR